MNIIRELNKQMNRQSDALTVSSIKRIQGKAVLSLSNGEVHVMPRAMLKERPYRSGMPFDFASFSSFLKERSYAFAMDKAVSLLAMRSRTEKEIVDALRRNAYPEITIARVMKRLNEAGYIDDHAFADQWVSSRTSKGLGARRIRSELLRKGVDSNEIDAVLSDLDEENVLSSAVQAACKASKGKDLSSINDQKKVLAALARRGFDFATARTALQQIMDSQSSR